MLKLVVDGRPRGQTEITAKAQSQRRARRPERAFGVDRDDVKANRRLIAGQNRAKQNAGDLDAELLVIELHFAVAGEDAVRVERRVDRHGHGLRFAVKVRNPDTIAVPSWPPVITDADDTVALESDGGKFVRLERFFGDGSIARRIVAAIAGRVDQDPRAGGARDVGGIAAHRAVDYAQRPDGVAADEGGRLRDRHAYRAAVNVDLESHRGGTGSARFENNQRECAGHRNQCVREDGAKLICGFFQFASAPLSCDQPKRRRAIATPATV